MKSPVKLSFKQRTDLYEAMKTICRSENGFAVYETGFTDQKAAIHCSELMGIEVTMGHISTMRREMFGEIMTKAVEAKFQEVEQVTELRKKLLSQIDWCKNLEAKVIEQEKRLNTIELALKFNVGVKVK